MTLSKDDILQADDLPREELYIPEWGGEVYIRTMTGKERDQFEADQYQREEEERLSNIRARLAVATVCDEVGNLLFGVSDAEELGRKSAKALDRILPVAQKLNGMSDRDIEELEKNS